MYQIRRSAERGLTSAGWLSSYHSFSFADYYDAQHMGFGALRVINEDTVQPGKGFTTHSHKNMEIISYVLEGALAHRDSMGNESVINAGEFQIMSAGSGVTHSEYNYSQEKTVHFLQIWIIPEQQHLSPSYQQESFSPNVGELILVASNDGRANSLIVHQQVSLYLGFMSANQFVDYKLNETHKAWIQVIKGKLYVNDQSLAIGDGVAISNIARLELSCHEQAQFLLFDLA